MNINCVVIDDERHAVLVTETFIRQTDGLIFQGGYTDPLHALDELWKKPADLAFIDVDMAAMNGLTLAEKAAPKYHDRIHYLLSRICC